MGPASPGGWELVRDPQMREMVEKNAWPVFASLSWALVMWLFKWHPDVMQPSLRSSMNYMWVSSLDFSLDWTDILCFSWWHEDMLLWKHRKTVLFHVSNHY
jgi:hypothetical protein